MHKTVADMSAAQVDTLITHRKACQWQNIVVPIWSTITCREPKKVPDALTVNQLRFMCFAILF